MQAADPSCKGLADGGQYACIERRAVETLNPDACRLAGAWVGDMCLQAVHKAANEPAVCDPLYLYGVRPTCRHHCAPLALPVPCGIDPVLDFAEPGQAAKPAWETGPVRKS